LNPPISYRHTSMHTRYGYCRRLPRGPLSKVWCDNCSHKWFVSTSTVTLLEATHSWIVNCPTCGSVLSLTIPEDKRGKALWSLLVAGGAKGPKYETELAQLLNGRGAPG
jgi:ribosomal protein S27E